MSGRGSAWLRMSARGGRSPANRLDGSFLDILRLIDKFKMCQKYWVYVVQSEKDNWTYTGHTNDVKRRLHEHNKGKMSSTRHHKPFKLIYTEDFQVEARL